MSDIKPFDIVSALKQEARISCPHTEAGACSFCYQAARNVNKALLAAAKAMLHVVIDECGVDASEIQSWEKAIAEAEKDAGG